MYQPERPKWFKDELSHYINNKLPHYFIYAKDKTLNQVEDVNESFVNKLESLIVNPRINTRKLGLCNIDYKLLMNDPEIECEVKFTNSGKIIKEQSHPVIVKYCELTKRYGNQINAKKQLSKDSDIRNSELRKQTIRIDAIKESKRELLKLGYDDIQITDVLVKYLYGIKNSKHKDLLWDCYGDIIYNNLVKELKEQYKEIQCVDCGEWIRIKKKDNATCRCDDCKKEYRKLYSKLKKREKSKIPQTKI